MIVKPAYSSDRPGDRVGERPHVGQAVDAHDGVGELCSLSFAHLRVAQVRLEFREQLVVTERKIGMAFRVGMFDFTRAERPMRTYSAAADVARRGRGIGR